MNSDHCVQCQRPMRFVGNDVPLCPDCDPLARHRADDPHCGCSDCLEWADAQGLYVESGTGERDDQGLYVDPLDHQPDCACPDCMVPCPWCGTGEQYPLGRLGNVYHYRCRQCGADSSLEVLK